MSDSPNAWELASLVATVERAYARCLSIAEIALDLHHIWMVQNSNDLLSSLRERTFTNAEVAQLAAALKHIVSVADGLPPRDRDRAHRAVRRVARLLPTELAIAIAAPFINYRCKPGREIALAVFRKHAVPSALVGDMLSRYESTGDQELLELLARSRDAVLAAPREFLLENINEAYWRSRVLGVYLACEPAYARSIASEYPREFAQAVGRAADASNIEYLISIAEPFHGDLEFLQLYAYALGRTGHRVALEKLRAQTSALIRPAPVGRLTSR